MKEQIFALIDVNNCYVSCERLFQPNLNNMPVIVLSNNDGCAVARSQEAKDLKIKMGVPLFQIKDIVERHNVQVLSSNYKLYAEMSRRFHAILASFVAPHEQEIYSIDECFLNLTSHQKFIDLTSYGQDMRQRILKWIGLPVCVGIGRSKTEAKLANHIAKSNKYLNGVCNLIAMDYLDKEAFYSHIDVSEIWGIGRKISIKLNQMGVMSVLDLINCNPHHMRDMFSVLMQNTIFELQGISCIELELAPPPKKQIVASRSFGNKIVAIDDLSEAMTKYVQNALSRLREENLLCGTVIVFVQSNPFDKNKPFYSNSKSYDFPDPTDNILELVRTANMMLQLIFKPDVEYKKCGVIFTDLIDKSSHIYDLLTDHSKLEKNEKLMQTYEQIIDKFGKPKIGIGASNYKDRRWQMNSKNISQDYFSKSEMIIFH